MRSILLASILSLVLVACESKEEPKKSSFTLTQFDGFEHNQMRDRDLIRIEVSKSESAGDAEITRQIREAVVADDSLSPQAKNINIFTRDGVVIIRGQVLNTTERDAILRKVKAVQGILKVDDQIEVTRKLK